MAKPPRGKRLEDALDALRSAANTLDDNAILSKLQDALRSGSGLLAKKAADIARAREIRGLREDLESACTQLLRHPEEDRGCQAKEAIARVLIDDPDVDDQVWLAAAHHVQMEGSFGPPIDTAAALRGMAAVGVAASRLRDKVHVLIDLLLDKEAAARAGAARALGYLGTAEALSLVRYKALLGDPAAEVVGECFRALLSAEDERDHTLPFVAAFLRGVRDDLREEAALALGESRDIGALPFLMDPLETATNAESRATLLRAIALLRREEAYERLAVWLNEASPRVRQEARIALNVFRDEPALAPLFSE
jgi:HEAT repeat protein